MTQRFGDFFNINISISASSDEDYSGGGGGGGGCNLTDVASRGWAKCSGPEMLGLLAEDDTTLVPDREETDASVVHRLRAWFAAVFDEVDEKVAGHPHLLPTFRLHLSVEYLLGFQCQNGPVAADRWTSA